MQARKRGMALLRMPVSVSGTFSATVMALLAFPSLFVASVMMLLVFFFSSRRLHTRFDCDWSSDVCSSDLARVWLTEPEVIPAGTKGARGRATSQPHVAVKPQRVDAVVAQLPPTAWRRITVAEGSQGPRVYEYAVLWVWFSEEGLPSGRERLLVRRSLGQKAEVKCHRSNA